MGFVTFHSRECGPEHLPQVLKGYARLNWLRIFSTLGLLYRLGVGVLARIVWLQAEIHPLNLIRIIPA